jgi:hypothetical protein
MHALVVLHLAVLLRVWKISHVTRYDVIYIIITIEFCVWSVCLEKVGLLSWLWIVVSPS